MVIPAYNEAASIRDVVEKALKLSGFVVVVDDASSDGMADMISNLPVTLLKNGENRGKAESLMLGMRHALKEGAEAIITLDADGQHNPEDIPRFIELAKNHPNAIVAGDRLSNKSAFPSARYNANKFANFWVGWAAGLYLPDSQCGFRLYPAKLLKEVTIKSDKSRSFVFESEILIEAGRMGYKVVYVPIEAVYNPMSRPSHFRPVADIARITIMVAIKLLKRGMYLKGLYRSLKKDTVKKKNDF